MYGHTIFLRDVRLFADYFIEQAQLMTLKLKTPDVEDFLLDLFSGNFSKETYFYCLFDHKFLPSYRHGKFLRKPKLFEYGAI